MSIKLSINNEKYRYDVYQIVKIFYPFEELDFTKGEADFLIDLLEDGISISSKTSNTHYKLEVERPIKENVKLSVYNFFSELTGVKHPWGTIVGIRPTKIAAALIQKGFKKEDIQDHYYKHFSTSAEKAALCYEVARNQKEYLDYDIRTISIYVGMPFCPTRCAYCSFASNGIKGKETLVKAYIGALKHEIASISKYIREKNLNIESVYFGGGTPTSVSSKEFSEVMESIYAAFIVDFKVKEFTVEAGRPDSINEEKLIVMKKYGVTRISINPQTMNDKTLKTIGRLHTVEDVINKYNMARKLGFDNINMDLIVGLPGEGLEEVEHSCREIAKLLPESITVHGMSIKRASKLHEQLINEKFSSKLGIEELNKMFDVTRETAENLGMKPYYLYRQKNMVGNMENIGYTKHGLECIYNIKIMEENQVIIALGADAATKVVFPEENRIERFANLKEVGEYVNRIQELINGKLALLETLYKA